MSDRHQERIANKVAQEKQRAINEEKRRQANKK